MVAIAPEDVSGRARELLPGGIDMVVVLVLYVGNHGVGPFVFS